ncbi:MAG: PepSY-like domain-containing protein [Muribaculaceae bacterium]|nr:PepSY-like domain-containing protein [Muribaculaceae bacterium]
MVKKIVMLLVAVVGISFSGIARDKYTRDVSVLPKAAQTTLANNFKSKVNVVKIDKDFGRVSEYEVILTDGTEITFDRNGNWDNVEVGSSGSIPPSFIPPSVAKYVKQFQPGQKIVGIEKERSGYEVELSNGVDMKFNKQGEFVRYD